MNKYKKKPLYLQVGDAILEPVACSNDLHDLTSQKKKHKGKKMRCIEVQSNADIEAGRSPKIWLYVQVLGVNAKDLELFGHSHFFDYVEQIAIMHEENPKNKKVDEMIAKMTKEQRVAAVNHLCSAEVMIDSETIKSISYKLTK